MIANSGYDEHGKYADGTAGDQTGKEWRIIPYYTRPWNCVLRHPDPAVREMIAKLATQGANNDLIGYDQNERWTFWNQLKQVGYYPVNINKKCEADCSAGVISIVWAVGYLLDLYRLKQLNATYTGNMRSGFRSAGFEVLTESKFLTSDSYLLRGDILLNDAHHTAINLTTGNKVVVEVEDLNAEETRIIVREEIKKILTGENTEPSKWAADKELPDGTIIPGILTQAKDLGITDGKRPKGYMTREEGAAMALKASKVAEDDGK